MDKKFWEERAELRQGKTNEERQTEALEDIADQLVQMVDALHRIADNGPAVVG